MSEYIHEIILQDFIIENIQSLNISIKYGKGSFYQLVAASFNRSGTFWDLVGTLENGLQVPVEVEWISSNFKAHKHHLHSEMKKFLTNNGILLVIRKDCEIEGVQQISILNSISIAQFKKIFAKWYKNKLNQYIDITFEPFLIGRYNRKIPRIILYPISQNARKNYFPSQNHLYRKNPEDPAILGFRESGYRNNAFIQDIKAGDICLFVDADGKRSTRATFIDKIKKQKLALPHCLAYKIKTPLIDRRRKPGKIAPFYWPDEIKQNTMMYPYICQLEDTAFFEAHNAKMPFIATFSEDTWETIRSCVQYGEYKELDHLNFTLFISNIKNNSSE